MINLKQMLSEASHAGTKTHGCLMAMVDKEHCEPIIDFGKKLVADETLYTEPGFGREDECHVTIKFGFKPDLDELQIRKLLQGVKPFTVKLIGVSQFNTNPSFDVIKFDVESDILVELNKKSLEYPHEDMHSGYHPHLTIAYVNKGTFPLEKASIDLVIPIRTICYSPISGAKTYYNLDE